MDNFERENAVTLFFVSLSALVLFPLPIATRHFSKIHGNPNYSMSYSRDPLTLMILDITLTEGSRLHSLSSIAERSSGPDGVHSRIAYETKAWFRMLLGWYILAQRLRQMPSAEIFDS